MTGEEMTAALKELGWPNAELARRLGKGQHSIGKFTRRRIRPVPKYVEGYLNLALAAHRAGTAITSYMAKKPKKRRAA